MYTAGESMTLSTQSPSPGLTATNCSVRKGEASESSSEQDADYTMMTKIVPIQLWYSANRKKTSGVDDSPPLRLTTTCIACSYVLCGFLEAQHIHAW